MTSKSDAIEEDDTPDIPNNYEHSFCCCGNLPDEACGWPQKTVRAMLAIIVVFLGLGAEITAAMWLLYKNETSLAISLIGLIATEVTGVSSYYFGLSKGRNHINNSASAIDASANKAIQKYDELVRAEEGSSIRGRTQNLNKGTKTIKVPHGMEIEITTHIASSETES